MSSITRVYLSVALQYTKRTHPDKFCGVRQFPLLHGAMSTRWQYMCLDLKGRTFLVSYRFTVYDIQHDTRCFPNLVHTASPYCRLFFSPLHLGINLAHLYTSLTSPPHSATNTFTLLSHPLYTLLPSHWDLTAFTHGFHFPRSGLSLCVHYVVLSHLVPMPLQNGAGSIYRLWYGND